MIDKETAEEMAKLMAKRLTETGAALMLGIDPAVWFDWKHRNKAKFSDILSRIREAKLNAIIDSIDEAGDGDASRGMRPDWRAKAWIAERVIAPERFQQKPEQAAAPSVTISISPALASLVYGSNSPAIDIEPVQPKQLPSSTAECNGEPIRS